MRRNVMAGFVFVGMLMVWTIARLMSPHVSEQAASMQAPHIGEGGLPQFQVDPNFPKVPAKWRMGFGSDVAIDDKDHVWISSAASPWSRSAQAFALPSAASIPDAVRKTLSYRWARGGILKSSPPTPSNLANRSTP